MSLEVVNIDWPNCLGPFLRVVFLYAGEKIEVGPYHLGITRPGYYCTAPVNLQGKLVYPKRVKDEIQTLQRPPRH